MKRGSLEKTKYWVMAVFLAIITCVITHGQSFAQSYTVTIISLGCPTTAETNKPVVCNPVVQTDVPDALQSGVEYKWQANDGPSEANLISSSTLAGGLTFTTTGMKYLQLSVYYPLINHGHELAQDVNITPAANYTATITSLGCPYKTTVNTPFTCTPAISTTMSDAEKASLTYGWSGSDLNEPVSGGNSMTFTNTGKKEITLTLLAPDGFSVSKTAVVSVVAPPVVIKALNCPVRVRPGAAFSCDPVIESSMTAEDTGKLIYAWTGADTFTNQSGSFSFSAAGIQPLTLTITHPTYADFKVVKKISVNVISPAISITALNCPIQLTEYKKFSCAPRITVDAITAVNMTERVTYVWSVNGQEASVSKVLTTLAGNAGSASVRLEAQVVENDSIVATRASEVSIPVVANQSPLRLTVTGAKMANVNSTVTMVAKTTFPVESLMKYTWTVDGQAAGVTTNSIQINIPQDRVDPITYSVTAKPDCCSMIPAETRTGTIAVQAYGFPAVTIKAPASVATNIAPYEASFLAITNTTAGLTYSWSFGDSSAAVASPSMTDTLGRSTTMAKHTYQEPGEYTVVLTVTDPYGESKNFQATVNAYALPSRDLDIAATFTNEAMRAPVTGYFKYLISGGLRVDYPVSSIWSVNGSPISEKGTTPIIFPEAGTYTVGVQVKTKYGNTVQANKSVTVVPNQLPVCTINVLKAEDGSAYGTYTLVSNCYDPDGKVIAYAWDLGNGLRGSRCTATITPRAPGVYPYSLTVTDDSKQTITFGNSSIRVY